MLEGKKIVVIAASSGIGLEVARQASERGADVTITGRSQARLDSAAGSLSPSVQTCAFDASEPSEVTAFFSQVGAIDHLVSCVGDTAFGGFLDLGEARAREVIEMKVWAQLFIVRACRPNMAADGSIVLTGGTAMDRATVPHPAAFSVMGNTALGAVVKNLAGELAPLRINIVEPTLTETALFADMSGDEREDLFSRFRSRLPIGRIPQPNDVARSYIHAMESNLINGDRLRPDGRPFMLRW